MFNRATGNLLVFESGRIDQFDPNGNPVDFAATGSPSLQVGGGEFVTVDDSGGPTQGNIYVFTSTFATNGLYSGLEQFWAFGPAGESLAGLVTTSLHPGHISGPGWPVINPVGNLDPSVWQRLAAGSELVIPGIGSDLMHHVHADDVAQAFALAVEHRREAAGQAFSVTAASALNVRGFATIAAGWFGREASLRSVSWDEFRAGTTEELAEASWQHLSRSQCMSIDKARRLLGYEPRYQPEDAAREAVEWMIDHGELELASPIVGAAAPL